jgi:hypothetical protein
MEAPKDLYEIPQGQQELREPIRTIAREPMAPRAAEIKRIHEGMSEIQRVVISRAPA